MQLGENVRDPGGLVLALSVSVMQPQQSRRKHPVRSTLTVGSLALALACSACGVQEDADSIDSTFSQSLSSAEEDGVLRFVNDCPTSLTILDIDAALDVRAATRIIDARNGADATCGTTDDQVFASLADLDAVPWVGNTALTKLTAHAMLLGYIGDVGEGIAGDYDGVPFTLAEAEGVLAIANGASFEMLDDDFGLDSRAANAIIDARPFAASTTGGNMQDLAGASYVGKSALQRLKTFIEPWQGCTTQSATVKGTEFSSLAAHDALDMLNQAPVNVLKRISGIGTVIAGRINNARPFENLAQLANVDGVGPSVAKNIHDETSTRWCPLVGARCGCPTGTSYRPPYVGFDENGLYYFLAYSDERWEAERRVDSGFLSHDGNQVVFTDVQVPNDPDNWQDITVQVFDRLWDCCLRYQYFGEPLEIGRFRKGVLHLGTVINAHDNKSYVMAYWQDIDDASFGWLFEKDGSGAWVRKGEVFLN